MDFKISTNQVSVLLTAIMAATGIAAILYAKGQLSESRDEARVQHLLDLTREFESEPLAGYRKALAKWELNKEGKEAPVAMYQILGFFEKVGLLVRHGYLDSEDTWAEFSDWVFSLNESAKVLIEREQNTDPTLYSDFTQLNATLSKIEKEKGGKDFELSQDVLAQFWAIEAETTLGGRSKFGNMTRGRRPSEFDSGRFRSRRD
jgi:hypothetical protein